MNVMIDCGILIVWLCRCFDCILMCFGDGYVGVRMLVGDIVIGGFMFYLMIVMGVGVVVVKYDCMVLFDVEYFYVVEIDGEFFFVWFD